MLSESLTNVDFLGVFSATVANNIIGMLWYSPALFGKPWMKLIGRKKEELKRRGQAYSTSFALALVTAYALAVVINFAGAVTVGQGALVGLLAGLGFFCAPSFIITVFESRPLGLFAINGGYNLVAFVVMGIMLAVW